MPENTPPAEALAILPPPAPPEPALGRLVEFDFEKIQDLRDFYEKQYDAEIKRRDEICRQYAVPVTLLGLVLAGNYALLNIFPVGRHIGATVVIVFCLVSVFYCLRAGLWFAKSLDAPYAKAIDSRRIEQSYRDRLTSTKGLEKPTHESAMKCTLALIHSRYRDESAVNAEANAYAANKIKKSIDDLLLAGCFVIFSAIACIVSPAVEKDSRPKPTPASIVCEVALK